MAEEVKQEEKSTESSKVFSTVLKVLIGLGLLVLGAMALYAWRFDLFVVIKGCIGLFLILAGLITLAIAKE